MKRAGNLYAKIGSPDNLKLAFVKASRGKQQRDEVLQFKADFEQNINKLYIQLQQNKPDIGNYHFFQVHDPKKRLICAASFPERVLHHAIINICESVFERYAIYDSYACRVAKGLRRAVQRCQFFSRRSSWYLKIDINKYFDSIDHATTLHLLTRHFKDRELLDLFAGLLATYHVMPGKGVPIGNLISQHLANFYLGLLDHWLKEQRGYCGYLRYMDDFVVFGSSKRQLRGELCRIEEFLQKNLALQVKDDWSLNKCSRGIPFLGFRILPGCIRLGRRSKIRFLEKFRQYEWFYSKGFWTENELSSHITPLVEFTRNADSFAFRKNVLKRYGVIS